MLQSVRLFRGGPPAAPEISSPGVGSFLDSLTHTLTGLALSRAGLNRLSPHAAFMLALAANAPDIDVLSAAGGALSYLQYHRHFTHALLAIPILAILPVMAAQAFFRGGIKFAGAYLLSLAGVASHVALDYTNIYGVRLKLPFSNAWFRLDALSIVDVWIWAVLLVSVLGPALVRLVNSEIGARPRSRYPGRGFPLLALCFLVLYVFGRSMLHRRATAVLESRLYEDSIPVRTAVFPGPASLFRWRGLVEGQRFYVLYDLNLREDFDPASGRIFYKPAAGPEIEAARRTLVFRRFLEFAQFPLWRLVPMNEPEGAVRVEAMDLRFGEPPDKRFVATAILDRKLNVQHAWFTFGLRERPTR